MRFTGHRKGNKRRTLQRLSRYNRCRNYYKRLMPGNRDLAIDWFVEKVAEETKFGDGLYSLVPIPDRNKTPTATHTHLARTLILAQKLMARLPGKIQHLGSSSISHTNTRKRFATKISFYENMVCMSDKPPAGYVILLDDVCTTGSHARAAGRRLAECGVRQICSMSVARTMQSPDEEVFGFRRDSLRSMAAIVFGKASS